MKAIKADLVENVTYTFGDRNKTFAAGRVLQKPLSGKDVLAPPLVTFADVNTIFGVAPGHCIVNRDTGRKFELQNVTTNTPTVLAFTYNANTGGYAYIGKIIMTLPLGVHSYKGFDFDDTDPNNIKIFVSSTVTTAICQSGTYYTWNVALSDFTISGTQIFMANNVNYKAVHFGQYAGQPGLLHQGTASGGVVHGKDLQTLAYRTRFYQQNGAAASLQIFGWDHSLGNPTVDGAIVSGVNSQVTAFAGTSPAAYFRLGATNPGYSAIVPTAAAFEAVILQSGSVAPPSNFVATPANTAQTLYYIRDLQNVGGIWYCNLSTTSTGAAVIPAQTQSGFTMMRGNGISTTHSLLKSGIITPAVAGTILQSNSFGTTVPTNVPAAPSLNGQDCLFLGTSIAAYLGKVSDLADGSTSWASLSGVNYLDSANDYLPPVAIFVHYSRTLDRWIFCSNTTKFYIKKHLNNSMDGVFGALSTLNMEGKGYTSVPYGMNAIVTMTASSGWLFITGSAIGQRGVVAVDLLSDSAFDTSYIITKVMRVAPGSVLRGVATDEAEADFTGDLKYWIRSAETENDPIFSSPNGGWTEFFPYTDNEPLAIGPFFDVKVAYQTIVDSKNISPAQLHDIFIMHNEPGEIDDHFTWNGERSSKSGDSPMVVSVRQVRELALEPFKFVLIGHDDVGNIVQTIDSSLTPEKFELTANGGASYAVFTDTAQFMSNFNSPSGDTEIRVTISAPPAVPYITWSFFKYA